MFTGKGGVGTQVYGPRWHLTPFGSEATQAERWLCGSLFNHSSRPRQHETVELGQATGADTAAGICGG
jgi:hypothetical protein